MAALLKKIANQLSVLNTSIEHAVEKYCRNAYYIKIESSKELRRSESSEISFLVITFTYFIVRNVGGNSHAFTIVKTQIMSPSIL